MAPRKTRPAGPDDARAYLGKAHEFLRAAQDSLQLGNRTAATGNAIHAGIAAADAITAARAHAVWKGEHSQAAGYLESTGTDGMQASPHLRRLLPVKSQAEYEPTPFTAAQARAALNTAQRLVAIAERAISSLGM